MSYKVIVSKSEYNALTETNIDRLRFSSDYNTLKYSSSVGSKDVVVNTSVGGYYSFQEEITHGLGYKPFFKAYVNYFGYTPVGLFTIAGHHNIHLMVTVDENKMYFIASGNNYGEEIATGGTDLDPIFDQFYIDKVSTLVEVFDYGSRNQCVDLATAWCMELKDAAGNGFPASIFAGLINAYEIYTNPSDYVLQYFDRIAYTVDNSPPRTGDIVVFNSNMGGGFGHAAIATGTGSSVNFDAFQQNDDPPGGNPNITSLSHSVTYPYTNVLGWLRYKNSTPTTTTVYDNINFTAVFKYKIFKNSLNL